MTAPENRLRGLPSVDRVARALQEGGAAGRPTAAEAVAAARAVLAQRRAELIDGTAGRDCDAGDVAAIVEDARARLAPSLRRVLNATGVVLHTNLGRAPLAAPAVEAVAAAAGGYVNLELDLTSGRRGMRDEHVRAHLRELTGAQDAIVVNNGAAAALLAVAALAAPGTAAVVSRGQLVEIGGGFRIPEVVAQAGARLVEVGTTNRTRRADYERALRSEDAAIVLRVHQSNFRTVGFTGDVPIEELCSLGVPVVDDVGSGALLEGLCELADEPTVQRSVAAGAALVCCSADKLLGGPQAGIVVGRAQAVEACRRHPLARALRVGRLPLAALEATLALYRDPERALREIPALRMLSADGRELHARARTLADAVGGEVVALDGRAGGGALPLLELEGHGVALDDHGLGAAELARRLRCGEPPLLTRISGGRVLVDVRTLDGDDAALAVAAIAAAVP